MYISSKIQKRKMLNLEKLLKMIPTQKLKLTNRHLVSSCQLFCAVVFLSLVTSHGINIVIIRLNYK